MIKILVYYMRRKDQKDKIISGNDIAIFQEEESLKTIKSVYELKNREYNTALEKVNTLSTLKRKIDFLQESCTYLENSESIITNTIKEDLISLTRKNFLNIIARTTVFKDVGMDEKYNLYIDHIDGYRMLHDLSGGEGEILALSFVMALNENSGFKPPNIIDRPITMVSGLDTLTKIANSFTVASKTKTIDINV